MSNLRMGFEKTPKTSTPRILHQHGSGIPQVLKVVEGEKHCHRGLGKRMFNELIMTKSSPSNSENVV